MKKIIFLPILLLLLTSLACRFLQANVPDLGLQRVELTGRTKTEQRSVSGFDKIQLDGVGELEVTMGDAESLTIQADEAVLPHIITEVKNGTLIISIEDRTTFMEMIDINYAVTAKALQGVELSGLGNIRVPSLETNNLNVSLDGAGGMTIDQLTAQSLDASMDGLGKMTVSGEVQDLKVDMSGAGILEAGDLKAQNVTVSIDGMGNATVWATVSLNMEISTAGTISYYGSPTVSQDVSGLGKIESLGEK